MMILEVLTFDPDEIACALSELGVARESVVLRADLYRARSELRVRDDVGDCSLSLDELLQKFPSTKFQFEVRDSKAIVPLASWMRGSSERAEQVATVWIPDISALFLNSPKYSIQATELTRSTLVPKLVIHASSQFADEYRGYARALWLDPGPFESTGVDWMARAKDYELVLYSVPSARPFGGSSAERLEADARSFMNSGVLDILVPMGPVAALKEWKQCFDAIAP